MLDAPTFRTIFPAFADTTVFSDAQVDFWIAAAANNLNLDRLGASADEATGYFTAHNLTLAAQDAKAAATGSFGGVSGPVTSKSVGGVSKSIDVGSSASANAGYYNATSYGRQLYSLLRRFSLGGLYVAQPKYNPDLALLYGRSLLPPYGF